MKTKGKVAQEDRLFKIPLPKILIVVGIISFIISLVASFYTKLDLLNLFLFFVPGTITFVWLIIYLIFFFLGYGLTNTRTNVGSITRKNIDLVKREYVTNIERIMLGIMIVFLITATTVLFLYVYITQISLFI